MPANPGSPPHDRPGRFDRVFLFPLPDDDARADLFRLHAAGPVDDRVARHLAAAADGLTGAHIRECCYGAAIRQETDRLGYADALRLEVARMRDRHRASRDYERTLRGGGGVGFGTG